MNPTDAEQLQRRFSDLRDRRLVQSTFVQFLEGIQQVFSPDSDEPVDLSDLTPYRHRLRAVSDRLSNPSTPRLRSRLDEIEALLDGIGAALLSEDSKVPPAIQRRFFAHLAAYGEDTIERLIAFYLVERDSTAWGDDALDRVDFLSTRLVKDTAHADGTPDWHRVQVQCESLARVRTRRWGPDEPTGKRRSRLLPELQESALMTREADEMTEIIERFRRFKHHLGLRALQPDLWPEILRANWKIKTAVNQVLRREERHVLADVDKVFEIESRVLPKPVLATVLAGLRQQVASFEEAAQGGNMRLEDLTDLQRRLRVALHRLEEAELASEAGADPNDDGPQGLFPSRR